MKAIRYTNYGNHEVLSVEETEKPEPAPNEILVKIHAASVTRADTMMREGKATKIIRGLLLLIAN